jgi:hypothetical protein
MTNDELGQSVVAGTDNWIWRMGEGWRWSMREGRLLFNILLIIGAL